MMMWLLCRQVILILITFICIILRTLMSVGFADSDGIGIQDSVPCLMDFSGRVEGTQFHSSFSIKKTDNPHWNKKTIVRYTYLA